MINDERSVSLLQLAKDTSGSKEIVSLLEENLEANSETQLSGYFDFNNPFLKDHVLSVFKAAKLIIHNVMLIGKHIEFENQVYNTYLDLLEAGSHEVSGEVSYRKYDT